MKRRKSRPRRKESYKAVLLRPRWAAICDDLATKVKERDVLLEALSHALERANHRIQCRETELAHLRGAFGRVPDATAKLKAEKKAADLAPATYVSDFQSKKAALDKLLMLLQTKPRIVAGWLQGRSPWVQFRQTDWKQILECMDELAPKGETE